MNRRSMRGRVPVARQGPVRRAPRRFAIGVALLAAACAGASDRPDRPAGFWKRLVSTAAPASAPKLGFEVVADIPLPGPLPDTGPVLHEDEVRVPVAGGVARIALTDDPEAIIDATEDAREADSAEEASLDPEGKHRARFLPNGRLVLEKRCDGCRKGWKRKWKLKVPGGEMAPPLVTPNRVYFGAPDNRVYSLSKKSGHRLWDTDLGDRVSGRIVLWTGQVGLGPGKSPRELQLLLVQPDPGSRVVALDARSGREVARFDLPPDGGRIRGRPLALPDGQIAVAREKYNPEEASLILLSIGRAGDPATLGERSPEISDEDRGDDLGSDATGTPRPRTKKKTDL